MTLATATTMNRVFVVAPTVVVVNPTQSRPDVQPDSDDETLLGMYLNEIGRTMLLTTEEERQLGRAVRAAQAAAREMLTYGDILSDDEIDSLKIWLDPDEKLPRKNTKPAVQAAKAIPALRQTIAAGIEARDHMITANTRLVVLFAKRFSRLLNSGRQTILSTADLIQEGNIGLMRAVAKFDPEMGWRFSTYASRWIKQTISRAIADRARTIRIPVHTMTQINRLLQAKAQAEQAGVGGEAEDMMIAGITGYTDDQILGLQEAMTRGTVSIDQPYAGNDGEEGATLADMIADASQSVEALNDQTALRAEIQDVLNRLPSLDATVIRLRFGLNTNEQSYTLEETGAMLGISREKVRRIEYRALGVFRQAQIRVRLREYTDAVPAR